MRVVKEVLRILYWIPVQASLKNLVLIIVNISDIFLKVVFKVRVY